MIGRLLHLVKCITKSKEEGEEEADLSNGSLLPVLKLEQTNSSHQMI